MTEIKYLRPELLEAIARNTLKKYDSSLILGYEAKSVPIEDIIESLGLTLEYQYIRKNGRILGETVFDDDYIPIYNMEAKQYELIFVERGTIILDASLGGGVRLNGEYVPVQAIKIDEALKAIPMPES